MTSTGVAAAAHADFDDNVPPEQSPDTMSAPGPGGVVLRLPPYSKGVAPMTLAQLGSFEIKAQTLFPTIHHQSGITAKCRGSRFESSETGRRFTSDDIPPAKRLCSKR